MAYGKHSGEPHPLFRAVFDDWQTRAGVRSALPDAPVVSDDLRPGWHVWRWLRDRLTAPPLRDRRVEQQPLRPRARRSSTNERPACRQAPSWSGRTG